MNAEQQASIAEAVSLLLSGELVAFPTETVYGLGADAANVAAVGKIFAAKGRPADHPLIVHLPGDGYLDRWASAIPPTAWELTEAFWPGPLTLILQRSDAAPRIVTGGQDTIGVRVPAHPLALALLRAYAQAGGGVGGLCGVAAPSANRFGRISPTTAAHVRAELGAAVPLIVDGGHCPVGIESTILDLSGRAGQPPRILRPGHITPEHIAAVIGVQPELVFRRPAADTPRVSGSSAAHYAPLTPLRLVPTALLADVLGQMHLAGRRYAVLYHAQTPLDGGACAEHRLPNDPEGYALGLYAALRDLDHVAADEIVVEAVADGPAWMAIADRLQRAACGAGRAGV